MKILLVGGGSGGHVTPVVAVAKKIHDFDTEAEIRIWTDKKFAKQTTDLAPDFAKISVISSGKFRRYANLKFLNKYFSWYHITKTHLPNLVDSGKIFGGFLQSVIKLKKWRPDVIFAKGGYVCLPVGIAAHFLKIPLVIHDSDTVPGLTNRVLSRWASAIATGSPVENYPAYPKKITHFVGIPVRETFANYDKKARAEIKLELGLDPKKKLIFVAGGGGGAAIFSTVFREIAPKILTEFDSQIFLLTGKNKAFSVADYAKKFEINVREKINQNFIVKDFVSEEYPDLLNACDVFITRAGATSLAEAAVSETATIIIPSPFLAGDHQTKNAEIFAEAGAAFSLKQNATEDKPDPKLAEEMQEKIQILLGNNGEKIRGELGKNLSKFARTDAIDQIVKMIFGAVK